MIKLNVKVEGMERLQRRMNLLKSKTWQIAALEEAGEYMVQSTHKAVSRGVDIDGKAFKPLSEPYVKRPIVKGGRGNNRTNILIRPAGAPLGKFGAPGELMKSIMRDKVNRTKMSVDVRPSSVLMQKLGNIHQNPGPRSHMPKRAFLGFRSGDGTRIRNIFKAHLHGALEQ